MKSRSEKFLNDFCERFPEAAYLVPKIKECVGLIVSLKKENKLLICGNGGSAADSEHIAGELLKSFKLERGLDDELLHALENYPDGKKIAQNVQNGVHKRL